MFGPCLPACPPAGLHPTPSRQPAGPHGPGRRALNAQRRREGVRPHDEDQRLGGLLTDGHRVTGDGCQVEVRAFLEALFETVLVRGPDLSSTSVCRIRRPNVDGHMWV